LSKNEENHINKETSKTNSKKQDAIQLQTPLNTRNEYTNRKTCKYRFIVRNGLQLKMWNS